MNTINLMSLNTGAASGFDYSQTCPAYGAKVIDCRCQTHRPDLHVLTNTAAMNPTRFVVGA